MNQTQSAFDLLDGDVNGYGLKTLREALFTLKADVKRAMDAGLDAEQFDQAKRVFASVTAAETAVENLYKKMVG
ncbi:MAG: hypothetical protein IJU76_07095 [Desulfovibrionaceae bacterium]|nr:hypothetical protein [Desulfovibrionaceae bacterium]